MRPISVETQPQSFTDRGWNSTGREMTWAADCRSSGSDWSYHSFYRAQKPETSRSGVKKPERLQSLNNAYQALLTRARQGMFMFVPPGAKRDPTRSPTFYEGVCDYLAHMGVAEV